MMKFTTLCFLVSIILLTAITVCATPKMGALCDGDVNLSKMTCELLDMHNAVKNGKSAQEAFQLRAPYAVREGKLQCIIGATAISDDLLKECSKANLEIMGTYSYPGLNQIVVRCTDPRQLDAIVGRSDVRGIAPEPMAITWTGSVDNQADVSINADDARTAFGVNGTGIRVGVMSDTVNRVIGGTISGGILTGSSSQTLGDLPASVRVVDAGPLTGSDEGAGMAELIYDLAPNCDISFASAFTSYAAFATNIASLVTDSGYECDVICDDVIYFIEPMYQNGPIAIAANNAYAAGVPYFSSAGNNTDNGHEKDYYDTNSGTDDLDFPASGNDLHDFGLACGQSSNTHLQVLVDPSSTLIVSLHWDEPYGGTYGAGPGSEADYDLYLVSDTSLPLTVSNVLESSTTVQGIVGVPQGEAYEFLGYVNSGGSTQNTYIVIDHYRGREDCLLHLYVYLSGSGSIVDKPHLADRTIFGHAAAENAMATGAMFYGEIDQGGSYTGGAELDVESFSSLGGDLPFWISDDGNTRYTSAQTCFKPEVTGPDGANTTFFGSDISYDADAYPNFFGTSAAAPHVAAVAALMLDAKASLSPSQVYSILRSTAVDAETTGADYWSGDGLVDAYDAVQSAMSGSEIIAEDTFDSGSENWVFTSVMGSSTSGTPTGYITITYNNTSAYSYWRRPIVTDGVKLEPDTLYRAAVTVTSSTTTPASGAYPDFRVYAGLYSGPGALYFVSSFLSDGSANYISPTPAGVQYSYYFEPTGLSSSSPPADPYSNIILQFEGYNFPFGGRPDLIGSVVGLDRIEVDRYNDFNVSESGTAVHSITDATGFAIGSGTANGWNFTNPSMTGNAGAVGSAASGGDGLVITANPLGTNSFAYSSFDANPQLATSTPTFSGGALYRATFNLTTSVTVGGTVNIPITQVRLQTGDSHISVAANLTSTASGNKYITPSENSSNYMDLWFYYPTTRTAGSYNENVLYPSFEILIFSGYGIPDGSSITLRDFWLTQHTPPTNP